MCVDVFGLKIVVESVPETTKFRSAQILLLSL